jgi:glucose/mannose transport system substrate-binding protein
VRDNTMFYNRKILESAAVTPPASIADWFVAADKLKASGRTPLAVSASGGWTIASHLFEGILVAEAGPNFYFDYMRGAKTGDAPEIGQALTDLGKMMDYANDDRASVGWADALKLVCTGAASTIFLPDFAQGQLKALGCGPDFVGYIALQPASVPSYLFATTGWSLTKGALHPEMGLEFLKAVGSKEGQTAFVVARGGVPARVDLDSMRFDVLTLQSMTDLLSQATIKALGYGELTSSAFQAAINPALQQFVDPSSPDFKNVAAALAFLKSNYGLIRP